MKSRSEVNSIWEPTSKRSLYLDSAFKELLHQEQKTVALQNRTKALGLSQEHIFRQVENHQAREVHLQAVQLSRSQEVALVLLQLWRYSAVERRGLNSKSLSKKRTNARDLSMIRIWVAFLLESLRNAQGPETKCSRCEKKIIKPSSLEDKRNYEKREQLETAFTRTLSKVERLLRTFSRWSTRP